MFKSVSRMKGSGSLFRQRKSPLTPQYHRRKVQSTLTVTKEIHIINVKHQIPWEMIPWSSFSNVQVRRSCFCFKLFDKSGFFFGGGVYTVLYRKKNVIQFKNHL